MTTLHHALETYRGHTIPHFRFVERRRICFAISGALIALSLLGLVVGGLNYSIDFDGGAKIQFPLEADVTVADIQATLADAGREGAEVQIVGGDQVAIRTESLAAGRRQRCADPAPRRSGGHRRDDVSVEDIGPTFGAEVRRQAITGLIVVLVAISLYIAIRFEPKMAVGAMIALVHDVVITAGLYALVGREVTPETVIAILTILGLLALRHRRDLRQDQGEHGVQRARLTPRVRGGRRPVAEPGADALGEHVAGRAAADPVPAAVRRRHAEGLRLRDVRRRRDRRVLVDLPRRAAARGAEDAGEALPADGGAPDGSLARRRVAGGGGGGGPATRERRADVGCRRASGDGSHRARAPVRRASDARPPSASGGNDPVDAEGTHGHRTDQGPDPRRARLPGAGHRLQGHHAGARRPDRVLDDHRPDRGAVRPRQRRQGRRHRGAGVHHRLAGRLPLRRRLRADPQAGEAALGHASTRTTSSSTARPRWSCTSTASTPGSGC